MPDLKDFARQLAQRFGVETAGWRIRLVDTTLAPGTPDRELVVGGFQIDTMPSTRIVFSGPTTEAVGLDRRHEFRASDE